MEEEEIINLMATDNWTQFLLWERASRDTIDFKKIYVDMADDLIAGLALSQIVYWYLPAKDGSSKLRVFKDGYYWIAKGREDWWDEIRISTRQVDRALKILEEKGLIVTHLYRFRGAPTKHVRIDTKNFLEAWKVALDFTQRGKSNLHKGENPIYTKGKKDFDQRGKSLTETTTETTQPVGDVVLTEEQEVILDMLMTLGVLKSTAKELVEACNLNWVEAWVHYAKKAKGLNDPAAFVVSKLQSGEEPPRKRDEAERNRHRYIEGKYGHLIEH